MPGRRVVSRDLRRVALGEEALEYVLVRRHGRRGVGLKVDEHGLTVSAPASLPLSAVEAFVRDSERWVLRKVAEWRSRRVPEPSWEEGAALPFLGATLTLRVARGPRTRIERSGDALHAVVRHAPPGSVRRAVIAWYKRAALAHFVPRVEALARSACLVPPRLLLSSAKSRWGSCNSRREVRLSWRLVKAAPALVDYVVCHELAHLRHMDHSRAFWGEVERLCPDYRRLRAQLLAQDPLFRSF